MPNSPKDFRAKVLGRQGEELVCRYLKKRKYKILERNYRTSFGEADVIAFKDGVYAFVEVKARETDIFGVPSEAVNRNKQERYRRIASYYCMTVGVELPIRFDVASVQGGKVTEYLENAF